MKCLLTSVLVGTLAMQPLLVLGRPAPEPIPSPPGIPSASTAEKELESLTVAAQGSQDGYDRAKFPHWIAQSGSVNLFPPAVHFLMLSVQELQHTRSRPETRW